MGDYHNILQQKHYVAGRWLGGGSIKDTVRDKYTGEELAILPQATLQEMESAIQGAVEAKRALAMLSAEDKGKRLEKLADLLEARQADFVDLIVREAGKPMGYAQGEINRCLVTLRTAAAEALRFSGEVVPIDYGAGMGRTAFTKRFPVGVVGAITPFNFPLNLALHKIAPALAVGCPIVVKPSPYTPLVLLAFADLVDNVGFPKGTLSVLHADIPIAESLVTDERIALLSFTGSDTVGWKLKAMAGKKKVQLELGGNAATVIDSSADLAHAANRTAIGSYLYAGQICISTQRIYVVDEVYQAFVDLLLPEIEKLKVGNPQETEVMVGPLIDEIHLDRIHAWVEEAQAEGAEILTGGKILDRKHLLYAPTLLTQVHADMKVCKREAFGPVAVITPVPNLETALDLVNDSDFGLQAGVFTNRIDHLKLAHETLEVGGILINDIPGFRVDSMPYGGIKDSGLGREGLRYAMEEMTEPRLLIY